MARNTLKTPARNVKTSTKVARKQKIENPFTRPHNGEESKSARLFALLSQKAGANLIDVADELDSSLACIRVRVAQLSKEYSIEKLGGYGEPIYRIAA